MNKQQIKNKSSSSNSNNYEDESSTTFFNLLKIGSIISTLMIVSLFISKLINNHQIEPYVDEIFHIPQTIKYCQLKFNEWDNKITTLPGLYILAFIYSNIVSLFNIDPEQCSVPVLRSFNLFCLILNFITIYNILKIQTKNQIKFDKSSNNNNNNNNNGITLLRTIHLSIFPIFYFFHFLFYTDVVSTCSIFIMLLFSLKKSFKISSFFGFTSVLIRQTNIIWVFFIAIENIIKLYENELIEKDKSPNKQSLINQLIGLIKYTLSNLINIIKLFWGYLIVGIIFIAFLFINGGIVVGDKSNHESSFHVPQLFYFSLFTTVFSIPSILLSFLLKKLNGGTTTTTSNQGNSSSSSKLNILFMVIIIIPIMIFLIYKFTYTHLFLLSDNRHYTFYIWNRFIDRYWFARYLPIPIYCFSMYFIWSVLEETRSKLWCLIYFLSTSIVLLPSPLVEPRYYIVPFFLFQLNQFYIQSTTTTSKSTTKLLILIDILYFILINFITIWIFIKYPFIYPDGTIGRFFY